jgi:hypothetical protein
MRGRKLKKSSSVKTKSFTAQKRTLQNKILRQRIGWGDFDNEKRIEVGDLWTSSSLRFTSDFVYTNVSFRTNGTTDT